MESTNIVPESAMRAVERRWAAKNLCHSKGCVQEKVIQSARIALEPQSWPQTLEDLPVSIGLRENAGFDARHRTLGGPARRGALSVLHTVWLCSTFCIFEKNQ